MKKLVYIIFGMLAVSFSACVDDYEDANPPRLLDAPATSEAISAADTIDEPGESVEITVTVTDAPAGLDSASILARDELGVDRGGSAELISGQGITAGDALVRFTSDACFSGELTLSVRLWDGQVDDQGEDAAKGSDPLDVDIVVLSPPSGELQGNYDANGTILVDDFGSGPYDYIEVLSLADRCVEGQYPITDISGGLYTNDYAAAYGTDPAGALLIFTTDEVSGLPISGDVTWSGVSDQFGGEIIQDPAGSMSTYDATTNTITIEWTATAYGERGITTLVAQ